MLGKWGCRKSKSGKNKKGTGGRVGCGLSLRDLGCGGEEGWRWYRSADVSYRDDELLLNNMCVRGRKAMTSVGSGCTWVHIHSRQWDPGRSTEVRACGDVCVGWSCQ